MTDPLVSRRTVLGWMAASGAAVPLAARAAPADAGVLRVVPQADLKIIDPVWTTATITRDHAYMVYDTLFGITDKGEIRPQMVDTFVHTPDGMTWTFTLRPGLAFHDGAPVTSADVVASIRRWASRLPIGQLLLAASQSIEAADDKSFRIVLAKPFGFVLDALGSPTNPPFIMPRRIAETPGTAQISEAIGSGPYLFKRDEYRPGSRIVYVKNPKYVPRKDPASGTAGGKHVYVDRVEWVVLRDPYTNKPFVSFYTTKRVGGGLLNPEPLRLMKIGTGA